MQFNFLYVDIIEVFSLFSSGSNNIFPQYDKHTNHPRVSTNVYYYRPPIIQLRPAAIIMNNDVFAENEETAMKAAC